jgi:S-adenosylmethionine hydrolase
VTSLVTLLTDFGLRDGYVGAMKGVLLSRCSGVQLVDLSHEIAPGAIDAGAYVLAQAAPRFPEGAVHLAVVDPGVGSSRRGVVVVTEQHRYVAPDNGLLTLVLEGTREVRVHAIENARLWAAEPSAVFHGRDVFAPVAAHLASGGGLDDVGPEVEVESLVRRPWPETDAGAGSVVHVDRFGNLVTSLRLVASAQMAQVAIAGQRVPFRRTYSDVPEGGLVALRGSMGLLEVACNRGSAAELLGVGIGEAVTVKGEGED